MNGLLYLSLVVLRSFQQRMGVRSFASVALLLSLLLQPARADFSSRFNDVQDAARCLIEGILTSVREKRSFLEVYNDMRLIESLRKGEVNERESQDPAKRGAVRRALLGLMSQRGDGAAPASRRAIVELALAEMRRKSDALDSRMAEARDGGVIAEESLASELSYDVVVIGAGVHDTVIQNTLTAGGSKLKVLTVEASNLVAKVFYDGSKFFLNSSARRAKDGQRNIPGEGDLNYLPNGVIQASELTGKKYPSAQDLADAIIVNRWAADQPILFGKKVVKVTRSEFESLGKYEIQFSDGTSVFADRVVVASGIGEAVLPRLEMGNQESSLRAFNELNRNKQAFFADQFLAELRYSDTPFERVSGKTVVVVGTGDSAKVIVEWLLRLGPDQSYGRSSIQRDGRVEKIIWIGQDAKTCAEYSAKTRARYSQAGTGLPVGTPDGVAAESATPPTIVPVPSKLLRIDGRTIFIINERGSSTSFRLESDSLLVLATGQKKSTLELFEEFTGELTSGQRSSIDRGENTFLFDEITGEVDTGVQGSSSLPSGVTRIARELKTENTLGSREATGIYLVGPAAGNLATKEELRGVSANTVSIFVNAPRTEAFTKKVLLNLDPRSTPGRDLALSAIEVEVRAGLEANCGYGVVEIDRLPPELYLNEGVMEIYTRSLFASFLERFKFLNGRGGDVIEFEIDRESSSRPGNEFFNLRSSSLSRIVLQSIAFAIASDSPLRTAISYELRDPNAPTLRVRFTLKGENESSVQSIANIIGFGKNSQRIRIEELQIEPLETRLVEPKAEPNAERSTLQAQTRPEGESSATVTVGPSFVTEDGRLKFSGYISTPDLGAVQRFNSIAVERLPQTVSTITEGEALGKWINSAFDVADWYTRPEVAYNEVGTFKISPQGDSRYTIKGYIGTASDVPSILKTKVLEQILIRDPEFTRVVLGVLLGGRLSNRESVISISILKERNGDTRITLTDLNNLEKISYIVSREFFDSNRSRIENQEPLFRNATLVEIAPVSEVTPRLQAEPVRETTTSSDSTSPEFRVSYGSQILKNATFTLSTLDSDGRLRLENGLGSYSGLGYRYEYEISKAVVDQSSPSRSASEIAVGLLARIVNFSNFQTEGSGNNRDLVNVTLRELVNREGESKNVYLLKLDGGKGRAGELSTFALAKYLSQYPEMAVLFSKAVFKMFEAESPVPGANYSATLEVEKIGNTFAFRFKQIGDIVLGNSYGYTSEALVRGIDGPLVQVLDNSQIGQ